MAYADSAFSTIPSVVTPPAPASTDADIIYIPQVKFGKVGYFPEIEIGRTREGELVSDILDDQITDIVRVLAIDLANGTSWDATRDIADLVFNSLIRSGSNVPEFLVDFLSDNIAMNELAPYLRNRLVA